MLREYNSVTSFTIPVTLFLVSCCYCASSAPEARNLLCSAEHGALWRHSLWLISFIFFALLVKLRNQDLVLFLVNSVITEPQDTVVCELFCSIYYLLEYT
jgi:hypothetical protein